MPTTKPVIKNKKKEAAFIVTNAIITSLTYFATYILLSPLVIAFYGMRFIDNMYQDYQAIRALKKNIKTAKGVEKVQLKAKIKWVTRKAGANIVIGASLLASVILLTISGLWFVGAIVMIVASALSLGKDVANAFWYEKIGKKKSIYNNATAMMLLATTCIGFFVPNILAAPIMLGLYAIHTFYNLYKNISEIQKIKNDPNKTLELKCEYEKLSANTFTALAIITAASLLLIPGVAPAVILTTVGMITFLIAHRTIFPMLFETAKVVKPHIEKTHEAGKNTFCKFFKALRSQKNIALGASESAETSPTLK